MIKSSIYLYITLLFVLVCNDNSYALMLNNGASTCYIKDGNELETINNNSYVKKVFIIGECDLQGKSLSIPEGCNLIFKSGSIKNGNLVFHNNKLKNPHFEKCFYSGNVTIKKIKDYDFSSIDDTKLIKWLIEQTAYNATSLYITRDYYINVHGTITKPYIQIFNQRLKIEGNGHFIYNRYKFKEGETGILIHAKECHNIEIINLGIEDLEYDDCSIEKKQYVSGTGGDMFLRLTGDCNNVKIKKGKIRHACSYIFAGIDPYGTGDFRDNLVVDGFTNFDLDIDAYDVGYAVAIYVGSNIRINLNVIYAHRGCRLQGVNNAMINIAAAYMTTPVCLLLCEGAGYSKKDYKNVKYHSCKNIVANIRRASTVSDDRIWYDAACNIKCYSDFSTEETAVVYRNRIEPYLWDNIKIYCNGDFKTCLSLWPFTTNKQKDRYNITVINPSGCSNLINRLDASRNVVSRDAIINLTFKDSKIGNTSIGGINGKHSIKLKKSTIVGEIKNYGETISIEGVKY